MDDVIEDLAKEAILKYFYDGNEGEFLISPTSNGSNNWVFYIDVSDERYVLRIYNNGRSRTRVLAEHGILEALDKCNGFNFAVPRLKHVPISCSSPTLSHLGEREAIIPSFIELSDGSFACFFYFLEGEYVGSKSIYVNSMGKATSELMGILQELYDERIECIKRRIDIQHLSKTAMLTRYTYDYGPASYCDLWNVHSAITRDAFFSFCKRSPQLEPYSVEIETLLLRIIELERLIVEWKQAESQGSGFPNSFVHGDLVTDNFLCDEKEGTVSAVLDFEFAGVDWRIMELATCISKFPEEADPMTNFRLFVGGFRETQRIVLEKREVDALPDMISLRVLSNVVYFVGRAISGEADLSQLTERIPGYCRRLRWLDDELNRNELIALFD